MHQVTRVPQALWAATGPTVRAWSVLLVPRGQPVYKDPRGSRAHQVSMVATVRQVLKDQLGLLVFPDLLGERPDRQARRERLERKAHQERTE